MVVERFAQPTLLILYKGWEVCVRKNNCDIQRERNVAVIEGHVLSRVR